MLEESRQGDPLRLLERVRHGDAQALGELLDSYRPYLSLLARLKADRQLQAKLDDSDLVQDVCLAAHRDFAHFRGARSKSLRLGCEIMAHATANIVRDHHRQRRDVRLERRLYNLLNQSSQTWSGPWPTRILRPATVPSAGSGPCCWPTHLPGCRPITAKFLCCGSLKA